MKNAATPKGDNISLDTVDCTPKHPPIKNERSLELALIKGPLGFTQPEAFAIYGESCLHSTISTLQNDHGILFNRRPDKSTIKHYRQKPFYRYWLADCHQSEKALTLLNHYRRKRGAISSNDSFPKTKSA